MKSTDLVRNKKLIILLFIFLTIVQIKTSNLNNIYSFTPSQIDQQIQRMNYYPPKYARLGYILEKKREVKLIEKYVENFIEVLDFNTYFPTYLPLVSLPFFLVGIYRFFVKFIESDKKDKSMFYLFLMSIFIQSFFGTRGKIGPVLILPILFILSIYGFLVFINQGRRLYEKKN